MIRIAQSDIIYYYANNYFLDFYSSGFKPLEEVVC